jgi:hypothetical protein
MKLYSWNLLEPVVCICGLSNEAVNSTDYILSDDRMIKGFERIWKEAVLGKDTILAFAWRD